MHILEFNGMFNDLDIMCVQKLVQERLHCILLNQWTFKPISFRGQIGHAIENYQKHACRWFSPGTPVSSTNETGRPNITEMLLKVVLNTVP